MGVGVILAIALHKIVHIIINSSRQRQSNGQNECNPFSMSSYCGSWKPWRRTVQQLWNGNSTRSLTGKANPAEMSAIQVPYGMGKWIKDNQRLVMGFLIRHVPVAVLSLVLGPNNQTNEVFSWELQVVQNVALLQFVGYILATEWLRTSRNY